MSAVKKLKTPPSVVAQVSRLAELSMTELKKMWQELFATEPPTYNRPFIERRLAYRIQEIDCKKHNQELLDKNHKAIQAVILSQAQSKRQDKLVPGTVLTRLYHDVEHRVTVSEDGQFQFEGRLYRSLSAIAREITGTQWSGPLFFGLRKQTKKKSRRTKQ